MIVAPVSDGCVLLETCCPCLRPRNSYLILQQGEAKLAKGALCLALQGIGTEEAEAFSLLMEEDGMLRQLAGNAFVCAYMLGFLELLHYCAHDGENDCALTVQKHML